METVLSTGIWIFRAELIQIDDNGDEGVDVTVDTF